ncbi:MAG: enoyl-CoA hydratase [Sulfobacillus acidophilus]|uniref:Enoyl-CoA hydratase n=1 Tax=Sulfobacillus acidophilus TaxID=53633 RepID=A0A2T2WL23_9FIRM|nr:MAG: enoyl-CoA hydratase [Sulfobacillus acidophilus]
MVLTSYQHLIATRERDIGLIVLNRPDVMNALNLTIVQELEAAMAELASAVRVVAIRGAGGNFCTGADLTYIDAVRTDPPRLRMFIEQIQRAFLAIERCPVPVVACVEGYALAGGFELIQACDIVVAADDAQLGDQHARFGLIPGGGGTQRLVQLVGRQRASALLYTGDRISGREAVDWGLVYQSFPSEKLWMCTDTLLKRIAGGSLPGLIRVKRLIGTTLDAPRESNLKWEVAEFCDYMQEAWEPQEGLKAFCGRRTPEFQPRSDGE